MYILWSLPEVLAGFVDVFVALLSALVFVPACGDFAVLPFASVTVPACCVNVFTGLLLALLSAFVVRVDVFALLLLAMEFLLS